MHLIQACFGNVVMIGKKCFGKLTTPAILVPVLSTYFLAQIEFSTEEAKKRLAAETLQGNDVRTQAEFIKAAENEVFFIAGNGSEVFSHRLEGTPKESIPNPLAFMVRGKLEKEENVSVGILLRQAEDLTYQTDYIRDREILFETQSKVHAKKLKESVPKEKIFEVKSEVVQNTRTGLDLSFSGRFVDSEIIRDLQSLTVEQKKKAKASIYSRKEGKITVLHADVETCLKNLKHSSSLHQRLIKFREYRKTCESQAESFEIFRQKAMNRWKCAGRIV